MKYLGANKDKSFVVKLYANGSSCLLMLDNTIANKHYPPTHEHDNFIFEDRLKLVCSSQKTSSVVFILESLTTGAHYSVFRNDFVDMVLNKFMDHGVIDGVFTFTKKGPGVGLKLWDN